MSPNMIILHFHLPNFRVSNNAWFLRSSLLLSIYLDVVLTKNSDFGDYEQGAVSIRKTVLPGMAIPMLKIRRPNGRLIFNMEIAIRR